jgi:DNA-binding transcriptional ArsR family regulator
MHAATVFRALGDPVRLQMVQRLTSARPCTIGSVSSGLGITRQGARKHLQVLSDAELVVLEPKGRDVLVHLEPRTLNLAMSVLADLERKWEIRLEALKAFIEEGQEG